MRFGLAVPTGTEGMIYPIPYADPEQAVELAISAERPGFDESVIAVVYRSGAGVVSHV